MAHGEIYTIVSKKFDGTIHRQWQAELIGRKEKLLMFVGVFDSEINHEHLGVIRRGTISYEFYWLDCWYNVFRFHEPDGTLRNFYCNINLPPRLIGDTLEYVDLDVDILVWNDFSFQILDMDEYQANAKIYLYDGELQQNVQTATTALLKKINEKTFPFEMKSKIY